MLSIGSVGAQVACFQYGKTLSCDGPRGNTTITELSRGQGIIRTDKGIVPYTTINPPQERRETGIQPLERLDQAPSFRDGSSFDEREAARDAGRPLFLFGE